MSDFSTVSDLGGDSDLGSTFDVNETNNDADFGDGDGVNDFDDSEAQTSQEDFEYYDDETEGDVSEETADQVENDFNGGTEVQQAPETNQFNETVSDEPVEEMSSDEYADSICEDFEEGVDEKAPDVADSDESDDEVHTETGQNDSNMQEPVENKNETATDSSNAELSNKEVIEDENEEDKNTDTEGTNKTDNDGDTSDGTEKTAHFENVSYQQGQNEYGYLGTCGPTSISNSLNRVTGTNEYTENKVLGIAMDNNLCHKSDNPYSSGGTTTKDVVNIIDNVKDPESNIHTEVYEYDKALSVDDLANRLDNPGTVAMAGVDSATLWDQRGDVSNSGLFNHTEAPSDHWITVDSPIRDDSGNVTGFNVIDSGSGVDYVDKDKFESMYVGDSEHAVTDPTAILISKEGDSINTFSSDDGFERTSNYKGSTVESDGGDPPSGLFANDLNKTDVGATKIDNQVKELPKVTLPESLSSTFTNGEYRTVETQEDVKLYRTYGGEAREGGAFATTEPCNTEEESRQKTALLPEWGNSCKCEVEITVPKGEILNIGTAEQQIDSVTGKEYSGGGDQILLPPNWFENHPDWITNVRELKEE